MVLKRTDKMEQPLNLPTQSALTIKNADVSLLGMQGIYKSWSFKSRSRLKVVPFV